MFEEILLCTWLISFSATVWYRIHHHRLDYSTDPSLCGLWTTKAHVAIGVIVGALSVTSAVPWVGYTLFLLYSLRNFKHLRNMNRVFGFKRRTAPGVLRSSMVRQQVQLHVGIGVSRCSAAGLFHAEQTWFLRFVCLFTLAIGLAQLRQPPLADDERSRFKKWTSEYWAAAGRWQPPVTAVAARTGSRRA